MAVNYREKCYWNRPRVYLVNKCFAVAKYCLEKCCGGGKCSIGTTIKTKDLQDDSLEWHYLDYHFIRTFQRVDVRP